MAVIISLMEAGCGAGAREYRQRTQRSTGMCPAFRRGRVEAGVDVSALVMNARALTGRAPFTSDL